MAVIYSKARKPARASVTVGEQARKAGGKAPAGKKGKKDGKETKDGNTDK